MKFLIPLLTLFLGNMKSFFRDSSTAITQQVVMKIRSLTQVLVSTIASVVLSCVGISLLIVNLAGQLDKNEDFRFTPGMILYLSLTVIAVGILIYSLRQRTWLKALNFEEKTKVKKDSQSRPLEAAIAMLILDFVEERQSRRTEQKTAETARKEG